MARKTRGKLVEYTWTKSGRRVEVSNSGSRSSRSSKKKFKKASDYKSKSKKPIKGGYSEAALAATNQRGV
jgi:YD repeat-containing protein